MALQPCWGVDVDKHPLGRQSISQAILDASLSTAQKSLGDIGPIFRDGDLRKGPLFSIIEAVEKQEREQEEATK